jgi:hypothetical protein
VHSAPNEKLLRTLGLVALCIYIAHGLNHLRLGESRDMLWICNIAPITLAIGCLLVRPTLIAMALMWLTLGTPLWLLDILGGGSWMVTSLFTHFGGWAIAFVAIRRTGIARRSWVHASIGILLAQIAARLFTRPEYNINLAHKVWAGWEHVFPSFPVYWTVLVALNMAVYFATEVLMVRVLKVRVTP